MKKNFMGLFVLFFTTFNTPVLAGWEKIEENITGTHYVDFERIRKVDGMIYYWKLVDFGKVSNGNLSMIGYVQGDCRLFRDNLLEVQTFDGPMGRGKMTKAMRMSESWENASPNSLKEKELEQVCRK